MPTNLELHTTTDWPRIELNGPAPSFHATTTHGPLDFHQWKHGKWALLFSHPADFTPVCTSEFIALARRHDELARRNVLLLGVSIDSVYSHIAWLRNIRERFGVDVEFPLVADLDQHVARLYNMVHEPSSSTAAVRSVFVVDPRNLVRAILHYPPTVGRNIDELLRLVDALQTADAHGVSCPANWRPGEEVILSPPLTQAAAAERATQAQPKAGDWYYVTKKI